MTAAILICVSALGVSAARWSGKLTNCRRFDDDEAGHAGFAAWLRGVRAAPVSLMVDMVDEDYRFETLPHTSGRDRKALVERKLKQLYRSTPYYAATLQTHEKGKRREDRFLYSALTAPETLAPWLAAIEARNLPVRGVYALPTVTAAAARLLKLEQPNLLVVSKHLAGLRQTFLKNGIFRITRITSFRSGDRTGDLSFAQEVGNTRMYLDALSITSADEVVNCVILDQDDSLATLRDAVMSIRSNLVCERLTRADLIQRLGVPASALLATPDALFLHLLGRWLPRENLAPAPLRRGYLIDQSRRLLFMASGASAVLAALWFAIDLYRVETLEREGVEVAAQTARYQSLYQDLTRQFPAAPVPSATLRQTVDLYARIRDESRTPEPLFVALGRALDEFPTVAVGTITWKHGRFKDAQTAFATTGNPTTGPLGQAGLLVGEIAPFRGDYRSAVATIRDLAERLRRDPDIADVAILKLPLDASSQQSLSGSTDMRAEQQLSAQFEIAVILREARRAGSAT